MTDKIKFFIDGKEYLAEPTESIWDVAKKIILIFLICAIHLNQVIELMVIAVLAWLKSKVKEL
jgi:hypothetical protein